MSYTADHVNATVKFEQFESAITETLERTPDNIQDATYKTELYDSDTANFDDTTSATEIKEKANPTDFTFSPEVVAHKVKLTITNNSAFNICANIITTTPSEQANWFVKVVEGANSGSIVNGQSTEVCIYLGIKDLTQDIEQIPFNISLTLEKVSFVQLSYKVNNQIIETQTIARNTAPSNLLSVYDSSFATDFSYSGASDQYNYSTQNPLQRANKTEKQGVGAWKIEGTETIVNQNTVITEDTVLVPDWWFYDNSTSAWTMTGTTITPTVATKQKANIIIPNEVDGFVVENIGDRTFGHYNTKQITIPNSVINIGNEAFAFCSALQNIQLQKNNLHYMSDGEALYTKDKTTLVVMYRNKTSYTLPATVNTVQRAAFAYNVLQSIAVEQGNTSFLSDGRVLFNTNKTKIITYANESGTDYYTIPNSVTSIGEYAFYNCYNLPTLNLGESTELTTIGDYAFTSSYPFQNNITFAVGSKLVSIGARAFADTGVNVMNLENCTQFNSLGDGAFEASYLQNIIFPENGQLTSIGDNTFYASSLQSITIPASVTSIGDNAFYECGSLKTINFEAGSQLTTIGEKVFGADISYYLRSITINFLGTITLATAPAIQTNTFYGYTYPYTVTVNFVDSATYNKFLGTTWATKTTLVNPSA